ncbi:MAG: NAD-dependent malic enzyme [Gammaproteobacteria bacterium RIFCSPHIGHO2_12_FULL_35_23]|nr:MAG: NAD-dependent malic enzyme [Gammaproteobacteria bacterium RIFCSPHIGHO2_12_FULL_35_23]
MLNFKIVRDQQGNINHIETQLEGYQLLRTAKLNKSNAFTAEERKTFKLLAKLPYVIETLDEQAARLYTQYLEKNNNLQKNIFLNRLHDSNETLFYRVVSDHLKEMLPVVYTPTVGDAVQKFSLELREQRGLFISYPDRDHIEEIIENRLNPAVDLIVVTDGGRVLGIGDQGIGGMDISIAKLMVYTLCAGVNPHRVLPIQLDVGTNNEELLKDPMYLGWRHKRIEGKEYDDFIDLFVSAVRKKLPAIYLHWEDFGRDNARKNLERYRKKMLTFNDDMQGTGATALSCVLSGVQATGQKMQDQRVVFFGAGTAGVGIADQVCAALTRQGLSEVEARAKIWLIDRPGLLFDDMKDLADFQKPYAKSRQLIKSWQLQDTSKASLLETVKNLKPTVLIGCSALFGAFNEEVVRTMAAGVEHPIILPLSNPTSKSEAVPQDLYNWTNGKVITATGSPFEDVSFNGKKYRVSQSNNAFVFPGLGLGVIAVRAKLMTDNMIWAACQALTDCSPAKKDKHAPILPDLNEVQAVSQKIARAVAKQAITDGVAQDCDIEKAINSIKWEPKYYPYVKV